MNILTKVGQQDNIVTYEHVCDTKADMANIEKRYITLGTVCIVLTGESEGLEVYMADSNKEWHDLVAGVSGSGAGAGGGLEIHLCAQSEVGDDGLPDIEYPLDTVLYLVPSGEDSGNLYNEYIYVNGEWEPFGAGSAQFDWSSTYHTETSDKILFDDQWDINNTDSYENEQGNQVFVGWYFYTEEDNQYFDPDTTNELTICIDHGSTVVLPKTDTLINENNGYNIYMYGNIDPETSEPIFTTYPIAIVIQYIPEMQRWQLVLFFTTNFAYVTITTNNLVTIANEDFQTAVNYATTHYIKYGGTVYNDSAFTSNGLYALEAPGAITLYIEIGNDWLMPILKKSTGEYIYGDGTGSDDQAYMIFNFYNLENGFYLLSFAELKTFNILTTENETIKSDILRYNITINNQQQAYIITKSDWDGGSV